MEQKSEKKRKKCKIWLGIALITLAAACWGCSLFSVPILETRQLEILLLEQLQKDLTKLTEFEEISLLERTTDEENGTDVCIYQVAYTINNVRYQRSYQLTLARQKHEWTVTGVNPWEQDTWSDAPIAGVPLGQALDDMDGYQYESDFHTGTLQASKITEGHKISDFVSLDKGTSRIRFSFVFETEQAEELFDVEATYTYQSGIGWVVKERKVTKTQNILEEIPDYLMENSLHMLRFTYDSVEYHFMDMKETYYDITNTTVYSEECKAEVEVFVHGETELMYFEVMSKLEFRYSDGWYFYAAEKECEVINLGYLNDTHLLSEDVVKDDLLNRTFRYGFAKDIQMTEEFLRNFRIEEQDILEQGVVQEITYQYDLLFELVQFTIRGHASYQYENGAFSLYSMSGDIIKTVLDIRGDWYGILPYQDGVLYLHLNLLPAEVAGVKAGVELSQGTKDTEMPEDAIYETEELYAKVSFAYVLGDGEAIYDGAYIATGNCSSENLCRIRLDFLSWEVPCKEVSIVELAGYFDCGTNEIVFDFAPDIYLSQTPPEGFGNIMIINETKSY